MENAALHDTKARYRGKRRQGLGILLAGLMAISACSESNSRIYKASNTGGDYAVLNCEELRVAQLSINQRLGTSSSYSNVGEPTILLQIQGETIAPIRESRDCPGGSTPMAVNPAQVVAEATDTELVEGRFLQVATFREVSNLDRLVAKLTDQGFAVQVRPITLAGDVYNRVVVGPLTTISEVAKIDAAILKMGLADAFFLKQ